MRKFQIAQQVCVVLSVGYTHAFYTLFQERRFHVFLWVVFCFFPLTSCAETHRQTLDFM